MNQDLSLFIECPHCRNRLKKTHWKRHVKRCPVLASATQKERPAGGPPEATLPGSLPPRKAAVPPKKTGRPANASQAALLAKKALATGGPSKQKSGEEGKPAKPGQPTETVVYNPRKEYRVERQLDGSPDPYVYRENGHFGSHPSFDGMNDEAMP